MSALNIGLRLYVNDLGRALPVTNLLNADGEECEEAEAVVCVAGYGDTWYSLTVADFTADTQ